MAKRCTSQFKVAAISTNTGDFGHHGHILVSRSGLVVEGLRFRCSGNPLLSVGDILDFEVDEYGKPVNWHKHLFESIRDYNLGLSPVELLKKLWS
jgi:hypothetical protein